MSAESRAALEAALRMVDATAGYAEGLPLVRAIRAAARAHLASERSEAVAALERVRESVAAADDGSDWLTQHSVNRGHGIEIALERIDAELAALAPEGMA